MRETEGENARGVMVIYGRCATQISIRSVITNRWSMAVTLRGSLGLIEL